MRRRLAVLALLLTPLPTCGLRIAEVMPDPDAGQREFVELLNEGNATLDLAGWSLRDEGGSVYTFPSWALPPGRRVVLWGGGAGDDRGPAWPDATVWNNAGDRVELRAPNGTVVDTYAYSRSSKGASFQLDGGAWSTAAPTPGVAPGAAAGSLALQVPNLPPDLLWTILPASVRHGAPFEVAFHLGDPNGEADVRAWSLAAAGTVAASGNSGGAKSARLTAPATGDALALLLQATDAAGATRNLTATLRLRDGDLAVGFPDGPIQMAARPGEAQVLAAGRLRLENTADHPITPLLDVAPFRAGAATVAPEGRLRLHWDGAWHDYAGPLTPLPSLAPGAALELQLRLDDVPAPLAAGLYGASFTVVPA